jgi:hypothetical protein
MLDGNTMSFQSVDGFAAPSWLSMIDSQAMFRGLDTEVGIYTLTLTTATYLTSTDYIGYSTWRFYRDTMIKLVKSPEYQHFY